MPNHNIPLPAQSQWKLSLFVMISIVTIIMFVTSSTNMKICLIGSIFIGYASWDAYVRMAGGLDTDGIEKIEDTTVDILPGPIGDQGQDENAAIRNINDFIFSVQDFYVFNPEAYEEFVDNTNAMMQLHNTILNERQHANHYYQIMESKKYNAMNSFHSLLHSLPNKKEFTEKFNRALRRLDTLLKEILDSAHDTCLLYQKHGLDVMKRQINTGPKEYNHYFDKTFTYQFF